MAFVLWMSQSASLERKQCMKRLVFVVLLCFVITQAFLVAQTSRIKAPQHGSDNSPEAVAEAKVRGAETAERDIAANRAVILYFGKPWWRPKDHKDEATGLPVIVIGGCTVTGAFVAEVEAYNRTIREWHAAQKKKAAVPDKQKA